MKTAYLEVSRCGERLVLEWRTEKELFGAPARREITVAERESSSVRRENRAVRRESGNFRREKTVGRRWERVRENFGAFLMVLGLLLLFVIGGAEDLSVIVVGGAASVLSLAVGAWLSRAFYGQERCALWLEGEADEDV